MQLIAYICRDAVHQKLSHIEAALCLCNGTEIAEDPGRSDVAASGLTSQVSTSDPSDESACLSADITTNELHECIKKQKRGKSSDIDGVVAEMIKDGGELLQRCILWLFNCMLASHGCEHLPIGLITAVHKTGDKSDRATAEAFYSSLWLPNSLQRYESRESLWADKRSVEARRQAGFVKAFRTTDITCLESAD